MKKTKTNCQNTGFYPPLTKKTAKTLPLLTVKQSKYNPAKHLNHHFLTYHSPFSAVFTLFKQQEKLIYQPNTLFSPVRHSLNPTANLPQEKTLWI